MNRARNKENNDDGHGRGGDDGDGDGGLETLLEKDVESSLSSRRGSRDLSGLGDGDKNKDNDSHRLSISGEALGSRRGSKDLGGDDRNKK